MPFCRPREIEPCIEPSEYRNYLQFENNDHLQSLQYFPERKCKDLKINSHTNPNVQKPVVTSEGQGGQCGKSAHTSWPFFLFFFLRKRDI